jgi:hypothetical protein
MWFTFIQYIEQDVYRVCPSMPSATTGYANGLPDVVSPSITTSAAPSMPSTIKNSAYGLPDMVSPFITTLLPPPCPPPLKILPMVYLMWFPSITTIAAPSMPSTIKNSANGLPDVVPLYNHHPSMPSAITDSANGLPDMVSPP